MERPKTDAGVRRDLAARRDTQIELLCEASQDELCLGERVLIADAQARAAAERKVCKAVTILRALWKEAVWIESFRIRPDVMIVLNHVAAQ